MQTQVAGHALRLLPSGAALHQASGTLLVADAHLGKSVSYRALGMPVPALACEGTFAKLSQDLTTSRARAIVFLGDFLHAARAQTPALLHSLHQWRARHADVGMTLVRGNHDERAGDPPAELRIDVVNEPFALHTDAQQLPLALCHHPEPVPGHYVLAGHWHPCVRVHAAARQSLRLACFWFGDEVHHPVGVLPAYGEFTGKHPIDKRSGDRVFAIAGTSVQNLDISAAQPAPVTAHATASA